MRALIATMGGSLFGLCLWVSGMVDTTRVLGWLDIFGAWDPTLAFVLGGAILAMAMAWRIAKRRPSPLFGRVIPWPPWSEVHSRSCRWLASLRCRMGLVCVPDPRLRR